MNNEPNKPIPAQELTEKELEGVNGGGIYHDGAPTYEFQMGAEFFKRKGQF